ncbi:type II toxin-antitoxin system RelE family toxin [Deinococcus marmoris]|uniref:type II toxin-antitoxin system RelE family toxin n=1 Tax=Deinococcus marmoris TaxID=249408 RepID=UPI0006892168|nr:type II toxin-antitoxin system RelE/ParE family toxin [Deinococcus marmoris]
MTRPDLFTVILTADARADLLDISDQRTVKAIGKQIDGLEVDPDQKGKQLTGPLKNFRSIRAAGQRYRIVYQVAMDAETRAVVVVVIGIRKEGDKRDAYAVADKRVK